MKKSKVDKWSLNLHLYIPSNYPIVFTIVNGILKFSYSIIVCWYNRISIDKMRFYVLACYTLVRLELCENNFESIGFTGGLSMQRSFAPCLQRHLAAWSPFSAGVILWNQFHRTATWSLKSLHDQEDRATKATKMLWDNVRNSWSQVKLPI